MLVTTQDTPENGHRMITIPVPARVQRSAPLHAKTLNLFKRNCSPPTSSLEQQRRRTKLEALAVSIFINTSIVLILCLIAIRPSHPTRNRLITTTVAVETPTPPTEEENMGGSASSASKTNAVSQQQTPPTTRVITSVSAESFTFDQAFEFAESNTFEMTSAKQTKFSPSMTGNMFFKTVRFSNLQGNGKDRGNMIGFFTGQPFGDGSDMVLFLDVSGSMKERSRKVERYVERRFDKAVPIEVRGCSFTAPTEGFLNEIKKLPPDLMKRSQFIFVCDLQDTVTINGIEHLQALLLETEIPKSLYIISFDRSPCPILYRLIEVTNGQFALIR